MKESEKWHYEVEILIKENRFEEARAVVHKIATHTYEMMLGYGHKSGKSREVEIQEITEMYFESYIAKAKTSTK